jgi:hypothetical protein
VLDSLAIDCPSSAFSIDRQAGGLTILTTDQLEGFLVPSAPWLKLHGGTYFELFLLAGWATEHVFLLRHQAAGPFQDDFQRFLRGVCHAWLVRPICAKITPFPTRLGQRSEPASQAQETLPSDVVTLSLGQADVDSRPVKGASVSGVVAASIPGPIGAVCALLTKELDPNEIDAWDKAEAYYDQVRECPHDVDVIAAQTPYSERQIDTVKDHLFYNTHELDEGERRFDADPLIANAWSRLQEGVHGPKDLQLLEHELFEARFESFFDTDYRTAHAAADRSGRPSGLYS